MNPLIAMGFNPPNPVAAYTGGVEAKGIVDDRQNQNALRGYIQQNGAGIMSGDQNALAGLGGMGPQGLEMAMGVQNQQLSQEATRQGMENDKARLGLAFQQAERQGRQFAAQMSAAEAEQSAAELRQVAEGGLFASRQGEEALRSYLSMPQVAEGLAAAGINPADITTQNIDQIAVGALGVSAGLVAGMQPERRDPIKAGAGDVFLDPDTYQPISSVPPKPSAAEEQIARIMETGVSRPIAIGITDGKLKADRDPVTGELQVVDMATGKPVYGRGADAQPMPETSGTSSMPTNVDYSTATGARGLASTIGNTASEILQLGLIDPENERATQALTNLKNQTTISLASAVAGRPSNFLLERFEQMTVQPNSPWQGEGRARERLNQTRAMLDEAIQMNADVIRYGGVNATTKSEAQSNIARLSRLRDNYDIVIESFGAREAGGGEDIDALTDRWAD